MTAGSFHPRTPTSRPRVEFAAALSAARRRHSVRVAIAGIAAALTSGAVIYVAVTATEFFADGAHGDLAAVVLIGGAVVSVAIGGAVAAHLDRNGHALPPL